MATITTQHYQPKNFSQEPVSTVGGEVLGIAFIACLAFITSGVTVVVYQCGQWLKTGVWEQMSFANSWVRFLDTQPPLADWAGILKLESALPLSVFLIGAGFAIFFLTAYLLELGEQK